VEPLSLCQACSRCAHSSANQFDEQHALDLGAMVLVVPTVHSVAEAREAVKWAYYPTKGGRSQGHMCDA
jgi:2-keto-3-deoxy-L-rhamnonate aldolase RhmA